MRRFLDKVRPQFEKNGRFRILFPVFEALDTFVYTPSDVTRGQTHIRDGLDLKRNMDIELLHVDQNTALSCGLVLNECITNSIKHGFKKSKGEKKIDITGRIIDHDRYELTIADNGMGFEGSPEDISPNSTFGIWLIVNIVEGQLNGSAICDNTDGTKWIIQFPKVEESSLHN